ncbi:putative leucine-rich repeat domain superfamily [Arabidopsis thaliana]|uniref:Uncharacterized protein n=1 Tax=Arabidopsis thaliana TaxID=3702 RepID=A0A178VY29_ARATH|nr:hypothetical protein AXX17_AT2G19790 [Arabidopsis thaliana]
MFSLTNNNFIGRIPKSISQLHNLYSLDLSYNKMEGTVPGCLSRLTWLSLSHNSFSSIGKSLEVLDRAPMRVLSLESNSFQGPFPHWVCKLRSLELLDMSNNSFSGSIPSCLRKSTKNLERLILHNNNFCGILPDMFVSGTRLKTLDVRRNHLQGNLTPQETEEMLEHKEQVVNWITAAIAYGPGVFCGLVFGHIFVSHKHD